MELAQWLKVERLENKNKHSSECFFIGYKYSVTDQQYLYQGFTLIDITPTGVINHSTQNEQKRNQQRNWETVIQTISLGAQPYDIIAPQQKVINLDYANWNPLSLVIKSQGWLEKDAAAAGASRAEGSQFPPYRGADVGAQR